MGSEPARRPRPVGRFFSAGAPRVARRLLFSAYVATSQSPTTGVKHQNALCPREERFWFVDRDEVSKERFAGESVCRGGGIEGFQESRCAQPPQTPSSGDHPRSASEGRSRVRRALIFETAGGREAIRRTSNPGFREPQEGEDPVVCGGSFSKLSVFIKKPFPLTMGRLSACFQEVFADFIHPVPSMAMSASLATACPREDD